MLKASLALCELDVQYSIDNFSDEAISRIESNWPGIRKGLVDAFTMINGYGISEDNLTSLNAMLPIVYYFYRLRDHTFLGSSEFEQSNARRMHRWLIQSLLVGAFGGNSDRTIALARAAISESLRTDRGFPEEALYERLAVNGRLSRLDERGVEDLLALRYGKAKTRLALSLQLRDQPERSHPEVLEARK